MPVGPGGACSQSSPAACLPLASQPSPLLPVHLTVQDQLVSGAALRLECNCRGDLALRHRDCALKWVQVKGSNVCELCKAPIRNIPPPPPRPSEADLPQLDEAYFHGGRVVGGPPGERWRLRGVGCCLPLPAGGCRPLPCGRGCRWPAKRRADPAPRRAAAPPRARPRPADPAHIHDFMPSSQDLVFDCIRVTWCVWRGWVGVGAGRARQGRAGRPRLWRRVQGPAAEGAVQHCCQQRPVEPLPTPAAAPPRPPPMPSPPPAGSP